VTLTSNTLLERGLAILLGVSPALSSLDHPRNSQELGDLWREILLWEAVVVFALAFPLCFALFVPYGRVLPFLAPVPPWVVAPDVFLVLTIIGLLVGSVWASTLQRCLIASFVLGLGFWLFISIASWQ
jgi:hypothetical protein